MHQTCNGVNVLEVMCNIMICREQNSETEIPNPLALPQINLHRQKY